MIRYTRSSGGGFFAHIQKPVERALAVVAVPAQIVTKIQWRKAWGTRRIRACRATSTENPMPVKSEISLPASVMPDGW